MIFSLLLFFFFFASISQRNSRHAPFLPFAFIPITAYFIVSVFMLPFPFPSICGCISFGFVCCVSMWRSESHRKNKRAWNIRICISIFSCMAFGFVSHNLLLRWSDDKTRKAKTRKCKRSENNALASLKW